MAAASQATEEEMITVLDLPCDQRPDHRPYPEGWREEPGQAVCTECETRCEPSQMCACCVVEQMEAESDD